MNAFFSYIERLLTGADSDPADEPILKFATGETLSRRALTESLLVMASVGKGKTTLLRTPLCGMLRDGFGGLVPVVKGSLVDDVVRFVRAEGRERDLIVLRPGGGHVFNPFKNESRPDEAAALLAELSEVLAGRKREGESEAFWREQLAIILRHLFTLCQVACGRLDMVVAAELFDGRANTVAQAADPLWREASVLGRVLKTVVAQTDAEIQDAVTYFEKTYPAHGDRLQGSLAATVSVVFDHLRRPPLRQLFTGRSTFTMDDLLDRGKICVVALPVLDSAAGRVANALVQFCFCRAAVKRARAYYSFLILDECQELVTRELMGKLAVLREFRVASVLLTQNLAVLDERIGETAREGLCGLMGTKVFGAQTQAATRQWASEQIGKSKTPVRSKTNGRTSGRGGGGTSFSVSEHEQWDYRVSPLTFAQLVVGETIVLRDSRFWRSRWHQSRLTVKGHVQIVP